MAAQAAFYYIPEHSVFQQSTQPSIQSQRVLHSFQSPKSKGGHKAVYPNEPIFFPVLSTIVSQQPIYEVGAKSSSVWADGPHKLIPTPRRKKLTGAVFCAREMANVHNMLIRGLNSILRQAPYIADSTSPAYNKQDVLDLVFYVRAWCNSLNHHHHTEESVFFPLVEQATGVTGLMDDLEVEHEEFHDGLVALKAYVESTLEQPDRYRWATMRSIINMFAPELMNHLHGEIDFLLGLEKFGSEGLKEAWAETEKVATKIEDATTLTEMFPLVLGCCDSTYEGGNNFPMVPKPLRHMVKHGFAKKHRGAWRFNPCDFFGRPQPLQMLPENRR